MIPSRVRVFCCAVALALGGVASAAETEATEVCCRRGRSYYVEPVVTYRAKPCYDPCEPVGPVRRFWRRVLLPKCPPPCPAPCPGPVVMAPAAPPMVAPAAPPVRIGPPVRPAVPPAVPPAPEPFPGAALRKQPPQLTPPTPPVPVRLERLASRRGESE